MPGYTEGWDRRSASVLGVQARQGNKTIVFSNNYSFLLLFWQDFQYEALTGLELTISSRLALNSEILLSLPSECMSRQTQT